MRISTAPVGANPAPARAEADPDGAEPAPQRAETDLDRAVQLALALGFDLTTEPGCRNFAREIACRTVMALQRRFVTKEAALEELRRHYRLGSFARKLWKREPVVIRADRLFRLVRAYRAAKRMLAEDLAL